jgi:hypothetical protein
MSVFIDFDFRLPASGFRLPASGFRLPASGSRLPASGFRLPASGFRLLASGFSSFVEKISKADQRTSANVDLALSVPSQIQTQRYQELKSGVPDARTSHHSMNRNTTPSQHAIRRQPVQRLLNRVSAGPLERTRCQQFDFPWRRTADSRST